MKRSTANPEFEERFLLVVLFVSGSLRSFCTSYVTSVSAGRRPESVRAPNRWIRARKICVLSGPFRRKEDAEAECHRMTALPQYDGRSLGIAFVVEAPKKLKPPNRKQGPTN